MATPAVEMHERVMTVERYEGDRRPDEGEGLAEGPVRRLAPGRSQRQATPLNMLPVAGRSGATHHCWEIIQSDENPLHGTCEECYAYFVQRDCWTLWALRDAGHKPCCQKRDDCAKCPVLLLQVAPKANETVQV